MDGLSRRDFLGLTGAAGAAAVLNRGGLEQILEDTPDKVLKGETSKESYRLVPGMDSSKSFGIVDNFAEHISDRRDVHKGLVFWLSDGYESFIGGARRWQFIEPIVRPKYEEAGFPVELAFGLGMQESTFRNYLVSYANAKGIWQMQWAGPEYGLEGGDYYDVEKSTDAQLEYLKDLRQNFNGNLEMALVDYNWGPGYRFTEGSHRPEAYMEKANNFPGDVRRYIGNVLAAAAIGLDPDKYGVHIPSVNTEATEVEAFRDLHHVWLGMLMRAGDHWNIGNLNPKESIREWFEEGEKIRIPAHLEEEFRSVPDNPMGEDYHDYVADAFPPPGQSIKYVVKAGDNLSEIADQFNECVDGYRDIGRYNGLEAEQMHDLEPGMELMIPCN